MIKSARRISVIGVAAAASMLGGCGIDQGGVIDPGLPPVGGGAQTTVVSGPITGFGSVLVNELTLETDTAQILIDGQFSTQSDLAVGQVIRAIAVSDNGRLNAVSIEHEENLVGPVELLDASSGTLTVLGQGVVVDAATEFDVPISNVSDLQIGDPVVVSGLTLPSGEIQATYVRRADPNDAIQITASVTDLNLGNLTFGLGSLTVDYSQAVLLQLLTGVPELDLVVEVKGTALANGVLTADEVRARTSLPGVLSAAATSLTDFEQPLVSAADGTNEVDASFVGHITASDLPGSVTLGDIEVELDSGTTIDGGTSIDLGVGVKVQIEGSVVSFGRVSARRVKIF